MHQQFALPSEHLLDIVRTSCHDQSGAELKCISELQHMSLNMKCDDATCHLESPAACKFKTSSSINISILKLTNCSLKILNIISLHPASALAWYFQISKRGRVNTCTRPSRSLMHEVQGCVSTGSRPMSLTSEATYTMPSLVVQ